MKPKSALIYAKNLGNSGVTQIQRSLYPVTKILVGGYPEELELGKSGFTQTHAQVCILVFADGS
jgi:hypothetical protein